MAQRHNQGPTRSKGGANGGARGKDEQTGEAYSTEGTSRRELLGGKAANDGRVKNGGGLT